MERGLHGAASVGAEGTGPTHGRPEALLGGLHAVALLRLDVVVSEEMEGTMNQEEEHLILEVPVRLVHALGCGVEGDDHIAQERSLIQREGEDVRGGVFSPPALIELSDGRVVGEHDGELKWLFIARARGFLGQLTDHGLSERTKPGVVGVAIDLDGVPTH